MMVITCDPFSLDSEPESRIFRFKHKHPTENFIAFLRIIQATNLNISLQIFHSQLF